MTRGQKLGYLFSEWLIAWIIFYLLLYILVPQAEDKLTTILILIGIGIVMFAPYAAKKWLAIQRSKVRTAMREGSAGF
jgi:hypothetical protein